MVSACAHDPIQLPDFDVAERADVEVTDPTEYPLLCEIPWTATQCWQRLDVFEDVAVNNKDLAQLNADIARDSDAAYDHILSAAKQQQSVALIREEQLQLERRDHFLDNWFYRGLIALGILVVAL